MPEPNDPGASEPSSNIDRELVAYLERAPEPVRDVLLARLVQTTFVGPLPPPEMIEAYDKAVPGMGRELLDAFLEEGRHRRALDNRELQLVAEDSSGRRNDHRRGMKYGLTIAILGMVIAGVSILTGHEVSGTIVGGAELTALVAAFLAGRPKQSSESFKKREKASPSKSLVPKDDRGPA